MCPQTRGAATRIRLAMVRRPVQSIAAPIRRTNRQRVGRVNAGAMARMIGRASAGIIMRGSSLGVDTGSQFYFLSYDQRGPQDLHQSSSEAVGKSSFRPEGAEQD